MAGSYATLGPRRQQQQQQQQQAVTQFSTLQRPHSKASAGLHDAHRNHHHHHQHPRAAEGADAAGTAQDDSGSSGYGGSPRQEVGVPATGDGAAGLPAPPPTEAAPVASTSTLSRTRSSSDHAKKGNSDVPEARESVGQGASK